MARRNPSPPPGEPSESLEARLRLEKLLVDIASRFMNLPAEDVEEEIGRAQRQVCDLLGFERSTVWRFEAPPSSAVALMRVVQPPDTPPAPARMDARVHFPWLAERASRSETTLLRSLDDLPPEAARDRETLAHYGTRSTGVFPIHVDGRVVAAISFASTTRLQQWPAEQATQLALVAQMFGNALARKVAQEAQQQSETTLRELTGRLITAQEQERAWLAKELHDGINQHLAMLAVELDLLRQRPPDDAPGLRARLAELSERAKSLSGEVHRLSHGLHPSKLERLGLVAAVRALCRDLEPGTVRVEFRADDIPRTLPMEIALCVYRVVQEAIWNVVKHGEARVVTVELHDGTDALQLRVRDDGRGFDPGALAGTDSLGLVSMRERVAMVGGEIRWDSAPGAGTTVTARIPIPPEPAG